MTQLGYEFTKTTYKNKYSHYWVKTPGLTQEFEKGFSWIDLSSISDIWAKEFIDELQYWDGSSARGFIKYDSTVESCTDKVQSVAVLAGYKTQKQVYLDKRGDRKAVFTITCTLAKDKITGDDMIKRVVPYNGRVCCVSVPTKMLIVRRNGVVVVCGNTEHSVMTSGLEENELETFRRFIEVYNSGVVSIVSDSWDYWRVLTEYAAELKDEILNRTPDSLGLAKVVFRPDSGDPVKIICGDEDAAIGSYENQGSVQILWNIFGGTINDKGYKTLNQRVGLIYGDSITPQRCEEILKRLEAKGFASDNIVFGIGSYTFQYQTRDTLGFAMKATYVEVNGEGRAIFKNPKTDSGTKKSAKGLLRVEKEGDDFVLYDNQTWEQEAQGELKTVFLNGKILVDESFQTIRERLRKC